MDKKLEQTQTSLYKRRYPDSKHMTIIIIHYVTNIIIYLRTETTCLIQITVKYHYINNRIKKMYTIK